MVVFPPSEFQIPATVSGQNREMTYADLSPGSTGFFVVCLLGYGLLVNLLAFLAFAIDKRRALQGEWRVPERTLLILATLGGWPGAKFAQVSLRHKTRKQPFGLLLNLCGLILPIGLAIAVVASEPGPAIGLAQNLAARFMPPTDDSTAPAAVEKALPHRFGPGSEQSDKG
jgi:uncharacterized membrane protein YsdA (DUF1294 family)